MEEKAINVNPKKKKGRNLRRFLVCLFLILIFLFLILSAILYIPAVQNFAVDQISKRFSKNINGEISIGNVELDAFKGLVVNDVHLIEDMSQDTVLSIESFNTSFKDNLYSLVKRKLHLNTVEVSGVEIQDSKGSKSHLGRLAKIFSDETTPGHPGSGKPQPEAEAKPFYLDVSRLIMNDIFYSKTDSIRGERLDIYLTKADLGIDSINLASNDFYLGQVSSEGTQLSLTYFEKVAFSGDQVIFEVSNDSMTYESEIPDTFNFHVEQLAIKGGDFKLDDNLKGKLGEQGFDPSHIKFKDVNLDFENLFVNSVSEVEAKIVGGSLLSEDEILKVKTFECGHFKLGARRMTFEQLLIKTNKSIVKDKLVFKYRNINDFQTFKDKVILEGNLNRSKINIADLIYFAPPLQKNEYFANNTTTLIDINGIVSGRINSLNTNEIDIRFGDQILLNGRMNSRNLSDVNNALLNLDLSQLSVSISTLSEIIPGFKAPANFYKLGRIRFNGRFDGYFQDFVAYGDLISDLGSANLDMRLDLKEGVENAQYSGKATLQNFDLATWSGNDDFGRLEVEAEVKDGQGLRIESVNAIVNANVNRLEYKSYSYEDFKMDGKFEKNLFDGNFIISDPNIDLDFQGTVDFTDSIPTYDFTAEVNALKLQELNLIKENFAISGFLDIKAEGTDVNNAQGIAKGSHFVLKKDDNEFELDSFDLKAMGAFPSRRNFVLNSSLVDVELEGIFKIEELPDAFISSLKTNYPNYTRNLKAFKYPNPTPGYDFNVNMSLKESEDIFEVLLGESIFIQNAVVLGRISDESERSALNVDFPYLEVNGDIFEGIKGDLFAQSGIGELNLFVGHTNAWNLDFKPLEISASSEREKLNFVINTPVFLDSFEQINIEGILYTQGENVKVNLRNTGFTAFGSNWKFNDRNSITFGDERIVIDDLILSDDEPSGGLTAKTLTFNDINEKGVSVQIEEVNTSFFNRLLSTDQVSLRGVVNGFLEIDNIFEFAGVNADLSIPDFGFNNHELGTINFQAASQSFEQPIAYELNTLDLEKNLTLKGAFNYQEKQNVGEVRIKQYPLDLLEYIIPEGISGTQGQVSGTLSYSGLWDFPDFKGDLFISNGQSKIDYLGTTYKIGKNRVRLSEGFIDFTDCELIDSKGHVAVAEGGLLHSSFRNFFAELRLRSPEFIGLNTTKKDNPSYYGFAQGNMDITFNGAFENIGIAVTATTGPGTVLNIPVEYTSEYTSSSFIKIVDRDQEQDSSAATSLDLTGLSLDMNVTVTEDAEVVIIFDETANDIMRSKGRGDIQLGIDQEGDFEMFGKYEVVSGEYLFTIPSLYVNKSFAVKSGGIIEWTGDPLDANLRLQAVYRNIQASLADFLAEYIPQGNARLANTAAVKTDVSLAMDLGGTISSPDIDFDISFPNLTGELKSLAEGKLSALSANTDLYNEQVFSLMIFRTLLNTTENSLATSIASQGVQNTLYSTISEFVSSQFSILLTSLFDEALSGNSYFTGIDVNFGASKSSGLGLITDDGFILPDEYDLNLTSSFNENKWNIQVGGEYVVRSTFTDVQYFNYDFVFEYYISKDRRLKLNVYARFDIQDEATQARRIRSGVGLAYRKEFNSFSEFFNTFKSNEQKEVN